MIMRFQRCMIVEYLPVFVFRMLPIAAQSSQGGEDYINHFLLVFLRQVR